MIAAIRAEFRKLLTVRSTYGIILVCVLLLGLFAFYIEGLRGNLPKDNPQLLAYEALQAINLVGLLISLIAVLLVTHEYRFNTILYTFTSSASRVRVAAAKFIAISVFAGVTSIVLSALSPLFVMFGAALGSHDIAPQSFPFLDVTWRVLFVGWAFSVLGLIIGLLLRSQVAALVTVFFMPMTIEPLLGLLLKENAKYLPYTSLNSVIVDTDVSHGSAALTVLIYVVVGWLVANLLLVRRDAN